MDAPVRDLTGPNSTKTERMIPLGSCKPSFYGQSALGRHQASDRPKSRLDRSDSRPSTSLATVLQKSRMKGGKIWRRFREDLNGTGGSHIFMLPVRFSRTDFRLMDGSNTSQLSNRLYRKCQSQNISANEARSRCAILFSIKMEKNVGLLRH
jgi:hypothetical protein